MKKIIGALAFIGASSFAVAQSSDVATGTKNYQFYVGPYANIKLGINPFVIDPVNGRAPSGVGISPDFGVTSYFPLNESRTFGAALDLGYMTYKYIHKPSEDFLPKDITGNDASEENEISERYGYINVSPYLNIWGFTLGLNVGIPVSAEVENGKDSVINPLFPQIDKPQTFSPDPDVTEFLKTTVEVRLGGMINVFENQTGRLNVNLQAGYVLSGIYNDPADYRWGREYTFNQNGSLPKTPANVSDNLNPKPISFSVGLSYLFTLPPM